MARLFIADRSQEQPPNDTRVVQEDVTLESGKKNRAGYDYDQFNNVISMVEYDLGVGSPGGVLRRTERVYATSINGYCYTGLNALSGSCASTTNPDTSSIIRQRRLMLGETAINASFPCYISACLINQIISEVAMICHACKRELKFEEKISRTEECTHCGVDVHSCLNCLNYDRSAHNQCREPQAEWQSDREKANFCDYFIPNKLTSSGNKSATSDTRSAFDDLFKK